MPVAIFTRYLGPTDRRGSRVRASVYRGQENGRPIIWSVVVPHDHAGDAHATAAAALRDKHFPGQLVLEAGASLDGGGVFTISPRP